jgi:glycine/D-amino acid oxidase-like deaminating enzyme
MGYARASRCVLAAARLARRHGAVIHESTPVTAIAATRDGGVQVTAANGATFDADRLVVCAGPWLGKLLAKVGVSIPIKVVRKVYVHLQPERNTEEFEVGRLPVWIDAVSWAYGFPRLGEVPGVKIAIHAGGQETSPDAVERTLSGGDRAALLEYARERFPNLSDEVVYEKVCLYTVTPDDDFIIDCVPCLPGASVIGGTSGHGFKFGPLFGEIARVLVSGEAMPYDLTCFSLSRFNA